MASWQITPTTLLTCYCVLTLLASLAGGWLPIYVRLTHTRLQVAISFVAGMMLGVAILHLLPHAWQEGGSIDPVVRWLLVGFLVMFFIQRFFHFHHHDVPDEAPEVPAARQPHHCDHDHDHTLAQKSARQLSWGGAALGLTLHSLIDGVALAASVAAESHAPSPGLFLGLGTFMVVILHKPFDAMAIGTLMAAGGWSRGSRHWVNMLFALAIPIGVLAFRLGVDQAVGSPEALLSGALAFTAGTFLCIAASDLLPELQFHSHDRVKLSVALIAGLLFSGLIGSFERDTHSHERGKELPEAHSEPH